MKYIQQPDRPKGCIFCLALAQPDGPENLIVHRSARALVMLNRYPYSNCHLLVAPRKHTATLSRLDADEMLDLFATLRRSVEVLTAAVKPAGFNIGMNLGRIAGAGITRHLHCHVVPRWQGDTNFMPIVAEAMVLPEHLDRTYERLAPIFQAHFTS